MTSQTDSLFDTALGQMFASPSSAARREGVIRQPEQHSQSPLANGRDQQHREENHSESWARQSRVPIGSVNASGRFERSAVLIETMQSPMPAQLDDEPEPANVPLDALGDEGSRGSVHVVHQGHSEHPRKRGRAKVLSEDEISRVLEYIDAHKGFGRLNRLSARAKVLASFRAGLRPCEISGLTARALRTATGELKDYVEVMPGTSKRSKGRIIPMHWQLREALEQLFRTFPDAERIAYYQYSGGRLIYQDPTVVSTWFANLYRDAGIRGAKGMSGRRTFATQLANGAAQVGGSIADVMKLLGHSTARTSLIYMEPTANMNSMVQLLGTTAK